MPEALDLFDREFVFTQRPLLAVGEFRRECERRGVRLLDEHLEALHRAGVLVPLYRVAKEVRGGLAEARRRQLTWLLPSRGLGPVPTRGHGLHIARMDGRVYAAHAEPYRPWRRFRRRFASSTFLASEYLYSPYQLLAAPQLSAFLARMRARRLGDGEVRFTFPTRRPEHNRPESGREALDRLVIALSALEAVYRPTVLRRISLPIELDYEAWLRHRDAFVPSAMLAWLGWDASAVREAAERLLITAHRIDPLREWHALVRQVRPEKWETLRGDALTAHEQRVAAEMLLQFHEGLAREGVAEPLSPPPGRTWHPLRERLGGADADLDAALMDYGLSPHPALVLIREGQTESELMPRVFDRLDIPRRERFIQIVDARGTERDLGLLAAYAVLPRLGAADVDSVVLTRPPTRFLVAIDPEGRYATDEDRRAQRDRWVQQLFDRLPPEYRTPALREDLASLLEVETWGQGSFEFAHFTDEEMATALLQLHAGPEPPTLPALAARLATIRRTSGNIEEIWKRWPIPRPTKPRLAVELWSALEARIGAAATRDELDRIPIVRIALRARDLARELPRAGVVLRR